MMKRSWLQALAVTVCALALTACGGNECDNASDCSKKGSPPAGQEYQCIDNSCELRNKPNPEPTCSPACATGEVCDASSGTAVCRTCTATQGCTAPLFCDVAANSGKGLCRACSDTGNGTDQGCSAAAPVCDPAAGNGAGVCKACADTTPGGAVDSGCSASTPMCDPAAGNGAGICTACVDSAQGNAQDLGCSTSAPVCDPAAASGVGSCKACVDSAQGTGTDTGCSDTAPICNTSASGGKGVCKACLDSATGNGTDTGCADTAPVCDLTANNGAGACTACVNSDTGTGTDLGCGTSAPFCDDTAGSAARTCRACVNSATDTGTDLGCSGSAPICEIISSNDAGSCKVCTDTSATSSTADLGCALPLTICDTQASNGAGACKLCLGDNSGCSGNQTCNAEGTACLGCANDTECSAPTPICKPPSTEPSACVECTSDTQCPDTRPACNTGNNICGCTSDAQCLAAAGNTDFCDTAASSGRGLCKICVTDANCASVDATKPYCDNQTACIQCRSNADCSLSQVCNTTIKACEAVPGADPAATSAQIAAVLAAANGVLSPALPIDNAFVTYLKPALGTDVAGFFLQAEPNGPAIFVADATALALVNVGDRVTLQVTEKATTSGIRNAKTVTGTTVVSSGHPVRNPSTATPPGLVVDRSSVADLQTAVDTYESELISLTGRFVSDIVGSGTGHVAFDINTAGITGTTGLPRLRVPATLADQLGLTRNCAFTLTSGPVWRFNTNAQPSAYEASELVTDCPAPKLLSARAQSATEVRLTFDRKLNASSVQAADFTIASLTVTDAVSDGAFRVTLTTSAQTAGQAYTVSVDGEVTDLAGKAVDPMAKTANFNGFTPPPTGPSLVINEVDYDNLGTDSAEYIEIYNRGDAAADLSDVILLLVNGDAPADSGTTQRKEYLRFPLSAVKDAAGTSVTSLPPGGYILAAPTTYFSSTPPPDGTLRLVIATATNGTTDIVQNGPDGIGLLQNATGTLIDSVFYEPGIQNPEFRITTGAGDKILNFVEGTRTSASDSNSVAGSLQRSPNGSDSNNNDYDFAILPNSPGAPSP